jgi:glycosyltransferase involved in cell wall biosynthesis
MIKTSPDSKEIWFEIAMFDYWSKHPFGIARVAQRLFVESLNSSKCRYFYFHPELKQFIVPGDLSYFIQLDLGNAMYDVNQLPEGEDLANCLITSESQVVLTGAGWDYYGHEENVNNLCNLNNAPILSCFVYDTIALSHPHFFEAAFAQKVANALQILFRQCDHFICISKSAQMEVKQFLSTGKTTSIIRLGEDIVSSDKPTQSSRGRYILCVGTLEVRKNHLLLYHIWRKLVLRYGKECPRLVLVGRIGWLTGDVRDLLTRDPLVNQFVDIRIGVPDEELVNLYAGCMFTVYPSFYEGYGLPVSESFRYGRVCANSNAASLPEINPFPELMFDPYDFTAAEKVITTLIENPIKLLEYENRIRDNYLPQTWKQSFCEFQRALEVTEKS